jgi:hypothetical protein
MAVEQFEKSNGEGTAPIRPKAHLDSCLNCSGSGLVAAISPPIPDTELSTVAGGGIGGVALAVACFRGFRLPFTNAITAVDLRAMDSLCNKLVKQSKDWVFSH